MSANEIRIEEVPDDTNHEAVKTQGKETGGTEAEREDANDEHAEALEKAAAAEDRLLRLAAEFENYKARIEREKSNLLKYAEEKVLKELLPSLDNLDRAIEQGQIADDIQSLLEGVIMTRNGLLSTLEKFGLSPLECVGEPFDRRTSSFLPGEQRHHLLAEGCGWQIPVYKRPIEAAFPGPIRGLEGENRF